MEIASPLYGAIEAGGTKWLCAVAHSPNKLVETLRIPTTTPDETIAHAVDFFKQHSPIRAIGVASFGPIDIETNSPRYGTITSTPKPAWSNTNIRSLLQNALSCEVAITTDVIGAALAEWQWGAGVQDGHSVQSLAYVTVGTGIGVGLLQQGRPIFGSSHPELGHLLVRRNPKDIFMGVCPFHNDCLEGLASGPAIAKKYSLAAENLPDEHPCWELEADYLSQLASAIALTFAPHRIVFGGGVLNKSFLLELIQNKTKNYLAGYISTPEWRNDLGATIVRPVLGDRAGLLGALSLVLR